MGTPGNRKNKDKVDFLMDSLDNIRDPNSFDSQFQHTTLIAYNKDWLNEYDTLSIAPSQGDTIYGKQQNSDIRRNLCPLDSQ